MRNVYKLSLLCIGRLHAHSSSVQLLAAIKLLSSNVTEGYSYCDFVLCIRESGFTFFWVLMAVLHSGALHVSDCWTQQLYIITLPPIKFRRPIMSHSQRCDRTLSTVRQKQHH